MNIIKYSILVFLILPLYAEVDYNSEIQPIFNTSCISCHNSDLTYVIGEKLCQSESNGDINLDECDISIDQTFYKHPYSIQNLENNIFTDKVLVLTALYNDGWEDIFFPFTYSNNNNDRTLIFHIYDADLQYCDKIFLSTSDIDLNNYEPEVED